jgi:toxin HigB-1
MKVEITSNAKKDLRRVPEFILGKFSAWVLLVENLGLTVARKIPAYHDEPLRGSRKGQRSIRLSRSYRAFYRVKNDKSVEFVSVEEVNKHDY